MKRIDALKAFMGKGIEEIVVRINFNGQVVEFDRGLLIRVYEYLDQDLAGLSDSKAELCESKDKPHKPKTKTARSSAPVKKVTAGAGKRRTVDAGKLIALHKAGWRPENIADELGCHVATVYNYLRQCKDEGTL